jgi:putative tricarboxylic transport membrane protein
LRRYDIISSLFLLLCGVLITVRSGHFPIGTFRSPGFGFLPLITGIGLTVLSGALLFYSLPKRPSESERQFWGHWKQGRNVIATVLIMLAYAISLDWLGFIFATFLAMLSLFKPIGRLTWRASLAGSILASIVCYVLFKVLLKVQLPEGPWRF